MHKNLTHQQGYYVNNLQNQSYSFANIPQLIYKGFLKPS